MERDYWLGRKRASFKLAQKATDAEVRLIHYDLAGFYSVQAARAARNASDAAAILTAAAEPLIPDASPAVADERYYRELVQGAEYLAAEASDAAVTAEHRVMAAFYLRRAQEAAWSERLL